MKKRILSIILALCMVFCLVPTTALAATQTAGSWSELQTLINQNQQSFGNPFQRYFLGRKLFNSPYRQNRNTGFERQGNRR